MNINSILQHGRAVQAQRQREVARIVREADELVREYMGVVVADGLAIEKRRKAASHAAKVRWAREQNRRLKAVTRG